MSDMIWENGKYRTPTKAETTLLEQRKNINVKTLLEELPQMIDDKIAASKTLEATK